MFSHKWCFLSGSAAFAAIALFALPATASPVVFNGLDIGANSTDPHPLSNAAAAGFDTAAGVLGAVNIITFESAPVGAFSSLVVAPGVTLTGSDVTASNQTIRNSPFGTPEQLFGYNTTSGGANFASLFGGSLTFSFTSPTSAFGGYFSGVQLAGGTINFSDGSSQSLTIPDLGGVLGGVEFIGFTDAGQSISSIAINTTNDIVGLDDVRFVNGAPVTKVPEPLTLSVFGAGVICAAALRRRRKNEKA